MSRQKQGRQKAEKRNPFHFPTSRVLSRSSKTDYNYIFYGRRSILRAEADLASVIRILGTRTDYIRTIFGD